MTDAEISHTAQAAEPAHPVDPVTPVEPMQAAAPSGTANAAASRPRTGPIVWGCVFLAACAFVLQHEFAPQAVNPSVWIAATAIGLGVLLLVVGVTVVVRNRTGRSGAGTQ